MKAHFVTKPDIVFVRARPHTNKKDNTTLTDIIFIDSKGREWRVPAGWYSDLASWPDWAPFMKWVGPNSKYGLAYFLHDYLCQMDRTYSKKEADGVLYDALRSLGMSPIFAFEIWFYVRYIRGLRVQWEQPNFERLGDADWTPKVKEP